MTRPSYPENDPVCIVQEIGWAPGPVWTGAEYRAPTRIRYRDRPAPSEFPYRLHYPVPPRRAHAHTRRFPCPHHEKTRGERGIAPLIHNLGTRRGSVVYFTPRPLFSWERTPIPTEQDAGWAPEPVWSFGRTENLLPLPGFRPRTVQPVP
jgi:hypothetical protein